MGSPEETAAAERAAASAEKAAARAVTAEEAEETAAEAEETARALPVSESCLPTLDCHSASSHTKPAILRRAAARTCRLRKRRRLQCSIPRHRGV